MKTGKIFALGGIAGPIIFIVMTVICGSMRLGYSHSNQFISELGATGTVNSLLMNYVGFIPSGILIAVFGISILTEFKKQKPAAIGSILIIVFGLGISVDGLVSCDVGCPVAGSMENLIHNTVAPIAFLSAIAGTGLLGLSFKKMKNFFALWKYSIFTCLISFVFLLALVASLESREFIGLWQRLLLLTLFLWCGIVGFRLLRIKNITAEEYN
ncbi:DUF998 domain-containing protein [Aequorivita todarodis]|uniref:DUF998 domain-containing protein n=1 Tax=Aequorivita todarodis TaxID=2036821 RepID=UPI00235059F2|nr:DUF998 domain-containing protein [Aequorivita todarodis]MDC8000190.1 DUF998 domain-containing protein [Aequorivita todarodis]